MTVFSCIGLFSGANVLSLIGRKRAEHAYFSILTAPFPYIPYFAELVKPLHYEIS
jgi:hypothetical protein